MEISRGQYALIHTVSGEQMVHCEQCCPLVVLSHTGGFVNMGHGMFWGKQSH